MSTQELESYLLQQKQLIHLEETKQREFYSQDFHLLKEKGALIQGLRITRRYFGFGDFPTIDFELPFPIDLSLFKPGIHVDLFYEKEQTHALLADIHEKEGSVQLTSEDFPDWIDEKGVGIKISPDNKNFKLLQDVLNELNHTKQPHFQQNRNLFFANHATHVEDISYAPNPKLNESQNKAIQTIAGLSGFFLLHGPPGTGKTTTLSYAAAELKKQEKKCIATAPSNAAVDHLSRQLIQQKLKVLRIGNNIKIQDDLLPYTLEGRMNTSPEAKTVKKLSIQAENYRKMASQYKRKFGKEEREQRNLLYQEVKTIRKEIKAIQAYLLDKIMAEVDVICGTPIALYNELPSNFVADMLFLDEAGQCLQPFAWCAMKFAKNCVFAGDPFQLPPTLLSQEASKMEAGKSILEVLMEQQQAHLLDTQYRMAEQICSYSNTYFYGGKLKTAAPKSENALVFYDTAGSDAEESQELNSGSKLNTGEGDFVLRYLCTEEAKATAWSIISPYQGQVAYLKQQTELASLRISTIDSFQGQESDGIILSLVRSNHEQQIGFLSDYRRMNVALTRAKRKLVIFADSSTIGNDSFYKGFLDYVEQIGAYRSVFELLY